MIYKSHRDSILRYHGTGTYASRVDLIAGVTQATGDRSIATEAISPMNLTIAKGGEPASRE